MDTIKEREKLVDSLDKALVELNKLIVQEIDLEELDPEKAKAAARGKIEAAKGYNELVNMKTTQLILIEDERNAKEGKGKARAFSGVEGRI